jgi:hypothetical protein
MSKPNPFRDCTSDELIAVAVQANQTAQAMSRALLIQSFLIEQLVERLVVAEQIDEFDVMGANDEAQSLVRPALPTEADWAHERNRERIYTSLNWLRKDGVDGQGR